MKNTFQSVLFLLLSVTLFSSGCAGAKIKKYLNYHNNALTKAANSDIPAEEKFDVLASSFAKALDEAISLTNPKRSLEFVQLFSKQNSKSIEGITKSFTNRIGNMSDAEKLLFAGRLARKPYTRELIANIPKFERKVNQKIATMKFLGKIGTYFKPGQLLKL